MLNRIQKIITNRTLRNPAMFAFFYTSAALVYYWAREP